MRISRPLYKYVSHAVTDNRLDLNPQHFSTAFIFLPLNFDGRFMSLVRNLNSGKQNVFLQTDQGSYTFYLSDFTDQTWWLFMWGCIFLDTIGSCVQEPWPEQTDLLYKSHIRHACGIKLNNRWKTSTIVTAVDEHQSAAVSRKISRLFFEYAHIRTATKRECFCIFSSTLSEERRRAALIQRAEGAEKTHSDAEWAKTQTGKTVSLTLCLSPVSVITRSSSWVFLLQVILEGRTSVIVYSKSTGERQSYRNWKKASVKQSVCPKVIKNRKVQVRCDSCSFSFFFSATRVSFRMIPSLEMSLMMLWTENWAVRCALEARGFEYIKLKNSVCVFSWQPCWLHCLVH